VARARRPAKAKARPTASKVAALHARLLEAPHDIATRTVYADALLEAGDKRGELIALQLARGAGKPSAREKTLEAQLWKGPLAPLREVLDKRHSKLEHGFLAVARLNAYRDPMTREQLDHPEWPFVRAIDVTELADYPQLHREPAELMDRIPHLAELRIDSRDCLPIAGEKTRERLSDLSLFLQDHDDVAPLEKLVKAKRFPGLRRLQLWNYEASAKRVLAIARQLPALERLDVFVSAGDPTRDKGATKQLATLLAALPIVGVTSQWGRATLARGTPTRVGFTEVAPLKGFGDVDPLPHVRAMLRALGKVAIAADTTSRATRAAVDTLAAEGFARA
jgi:uncharacterized protein (TIGR02996 family)